MRLNGCERCGIRCDGALARALHDVGGCIQRELEAVKLREARRIASAAWLFNRGWFHETCEDGCPQDDTCTCLATDHARVVLNGPSKMPPPDRFADSCACGAVECTGVEDGVFHACGGPAEACMVPGCRECGTPRHGGDNSQRV